MMGPCGAVAMLVLHTVQASPLNGTWELTRIFRAGPVPATRAVPIDSTVYLRITLETHVGDTLRFGTSLVPDADSLELKRVSPDAPYPATVLEVVTPP